MTSSDKTPYVEYKVPRLLWENFESVLLAQSRRFIGEMARRLDVSERELQRRVLPSSDSLKVMMMDSQAESLQCRAYLQHDNMTTFCRNPVTYHSEYCSFHQKKRMNIVTDTQPTIVERLKNIPTKEPMWIQGNMIINSKGEMMGKINHETQKVKWFIITE
jgi:hypothetical protein